MQTDQRIGPWLTQAGIQVPGPSPLSPGRPTAVTKRRTGDTLSRDEARSAEGPTWPLFVRCPCRGLGMLPQVPAVTSGPTNSMANVP